MKFDNDKLKKYDISPLLRKEMFAPLQDPELRKSVRSDQDGYAVVWCI